MKNKNRLEIRLDADTLELLNSLIARTSLTKTSIIKKALIVYASALNKGHIYTVHLKGEKSIDSKEDEKKSHQYQIEKIQEIIEEPIKEPIKRFEDYTDEELNNMSAEEYEKLLPF